MLFGKERLEDLELGKLEEEEEAEQGGGALEGTEEMEKAENVVAVTEPRKEDTSPMSTDSTPSAMSVDPPHSRSSSLPATFLPAPNTSLPAPSPYSSLPMCLASPIPPPAVSVMSVKARKKCDVFDEVIMSESEEVDDPKALGYLGTGRLRIPLLLR